MLTISGPDNSKTLKVDCVNKLCCETFTYNRRCNSKCGMMDSRPRKTGFESWFYYLLAVDLGQERLCPSLILIFSLVKQ